MACEFHLVSTVAVAALPDAAPNTTPPADKRLLLLQLQPPNGRGVSDCGRVNFFFRSDNHVAGTVTWTAWAKDERSQGFVSIGSGIATVDRTNVSLPVPLGATVFVQITATAGFVAATNIETRATEAIS